MTGAKTFDREVPRRYGLSPWLLLTATDVVAIATLSRCFSGPGEARARHSGLHRRPPAGRGRAPAGDAARVAARLSRRLSPPDCCWRPRLGARAAGRVRASARDHRRPHVHFPLAARFDLACRGPPARDRLVDLLGQDRASRRGTRARTRHGMGGRSGGAGLGGAVRRRGAACCPRPRAGVRRRGVHRHARDLDRTSRGVGWDRRVGARVPVDITS